MPKLPRILVLVVASIGLAAIGHAQVLTADTITGFDAATSYSAGATLGNGNATTQTFAVPASGFNAIEQLTFRFITVDSNTFSTTSLDTYFSTWNTGSNSAATQQAPVGAIILADYTSWTDSGDGYLYYDASIDLSSYASGLSTSTTYGLSILGNSVSAGGAIKLAGGSSDFTTGDGIYQFFSPVTDFSSLSSVPGTSIGNDYAFTATSLSPVPETSSVAVVLAALFVAGLVTMRIRQRRQQLVAVAQA